MDLNYNSKIDQIQILLKNWQGRSLTPLGKITVIKSLMLSRITHLLLSLPNPCNRFIKDLTLLFYKFIWNGKRDKVKRATLCKSLEEGGLKMIEINVFIDSLKVTWIRKMLKKDKCRWIALLKEDVPDLDLQKYNGSRFLFSKRSAVNPFWRDVFSSFARFSERCIPKYFQISPRTNPIPPQNQNRGNGYFKTSLAKARH